MYKVGVWVRIVDCHQELVCHTPCWVFLSSVDGESQKGFKRGVACSHFCLSIKLSSGYRDKPDS